MSDLETRIAQGRGDEPADLVLRGGIVWDLVTDTMIEGDVAICEDTIVGIGADYKSKVQIDVDGQTLVQVLSTRICILSRLLLPRLSLTAALHLLVLPPQFAILTRLPMLSAPMASATSRKPARTHLWISECSYLLVCHRLIWKLQVRKLTPQTSYL